jgi:hypothetical protein
VGIVNDKINATIVIVVAVVLIGGAVASAVHFLGGPPAIVVRAPTYSNGVFVPPDHPQRPPMRILEQGGKIGQSN